MELVSVQLQSEPNLISPAGDSSEEGNFSWEWQLIERLQRFWKTGQTKSDCVQFLWRYGAIWFSNLGVRDIEGLLGKVD